ncbi:SLIT-ROBO Rho GTPase-activating protein 3 [Geodia barretti]|uniref:SLIT-ROBO Rho GTPase-activating protein 3 n=1 Tax=Geodia barretti TaxID=519541 RepID=A0AA35TIE1_GEOBA|nr:SLIT-ROBO Rho GTPase-activating protein 3 [Geodia barretti]
MSRQTSRPADLDTQLKDIRRQLNDQLGCLDFRMESKLSLLAEFQEFFKKRGEVEYEYARSLERLCEKFERSTKQRNLRNEVRSSFNLWSTVLAETRKLSRERASLAETLASEMVARLDIMAKDVHILTKKCREICAEVQDHFLKELRDLGEQTKVYHHSCYNTHEAEVKFIKSHEKVEAARNATQKKKALGKEAERNRQYKVQKHLVMKNRNDLLVDICKCNSFSMQYFNMDIMDIIEYMDYDYHVSFERLAMAYKDAEAESCEAVMACARSVMDQAKGLNFENDLHYFLSENPGPFTPPNPFSFQPYDGDDVMEYKVNTQDVFERAKKTVESIHSNIQTLEIQREEDAKTVLHMEQVNLKKYRITSVEDALSVLEEAGDAMTVDTGGQSRGSASLDRGLAYQTRASQAITLSQRGKKDALHFTLGVRLFLSVYLFRFPYHWFLQVLQRRVSRSDKLALAHSQLDILEKALDEQKIPPVAVGVDASVPGEVPKLFGGNVVEYLKATGSEIPLIVSSCMRAIEKEGLKMEGLFRVPGPAAYTEDLRKAFEEGRDPLLYVSNKVDIAGVASVLKGYFRELQVPLFPTDNYKAFINCTRQDDVTSRLESLQNTLTLVHPAVFKVMKHLFKFLFRVSLHSSDNKMTSANLALVFGPTLTRAPPDADPRQLHNDVPSVNMLIQLCIDHHLQVFGEEEEEEEDSAMMAPPPSYSPPHESPTWPAEGIVSPPPTPSSSQTKEEETVVSPPTQEPVNSPPPPLPPHDPKPPISPRPP